MASVVLHYHHGVSHVTKAGQGVDQAGVVVRVKANSWLVANVQDPGQSGPYLSGQPDPLGLAAGKGAGRSVHGHIVQAYILQKTQPALDFLEDLVAYGLVSGGQSFSRMVPGGVRVYLPDPRGRLADVLRANFHDAQAANGDRQGFGPETHAAAGLARPRRHIALNFLAGVVGLGLPVAALQVGDHPFKGRVPTVGTPLMGLVVDGDLLGLVAVKDKVYLFLGQVLNRGLGRETVAPGHRLQEAYIPAAGSASPGPRGNGPFSQG